MATVNTLPESTVYYTQLSLSKYVRGDAFKVSNETPDLIVRLPLPTELRDDTTVGYNPVNLETVGDLLINPGRAIEAAVTRNVGQIISAGVGAIPNGVNSVAAGRGLLPAALAAVTSAGASAVQSLLPAEQINSAIQQQMGAAPNPNPSVQFQGPVLRDFSFSWAFYPKNKDESATIDKLIRQLKARALPSKNGSNGATILSYPHICQLNFYPWDGKGTSDESHGWTDESIIKIKKCFMSGVNVNYNAFGTPGFFEDSQLPISYNLTISFKEIEYLLSSDWDKGEDVANLRANTELNAASALAQTGKVFADAAIGIPGAVGKIAADFITGNYTTSAQEESAADDNAKAALSNLVNNKEDSRVVWNVPRNLLGFSTGALGATEYVSRKVNDKFVVEVYEPGNASEIGGPAVPPAPTIKTFDTEEESRDFLRTAGVFTRGTQISPPTPKAPASPP